MDEGIKRAIVITVVVVVFAKIASAGYDWLVGNSSDELDANLQARESSFSQELADQAEAKMAAHRAKRCLEIQQSKLCDRPKDLYAVRRCLREMRTADCGALPRVNLCAVVESLETCADGWADQDKNGCNRLRRTADCKGRPIPEDPAERQNLWKLRLDDGMWDGSASFD